jgi:beta-lactamase superfamily II metal-dependent hydrolase
VIGRGWPPRIRKGQNPATFVQQEPGYVSSDALDGQPLLEVYFIDVGQGDGTLIRFPDGRHVLIDGGDLRRRQPTHKNAADFVDWKFYQDYRRDEIHIQAMIASHCDVDHYGGLWDLLNTNELDEIDVTSVRVDAFYHAGVAWWKKPGGTRWLGPTKQGYLMQLMEGKDHIEQALDPNAPGPKLQGWWAKFVQSVVTHVPTVSTVRRLSQHDGYVPGFEPAAGNASLKILAPLELTVNGNPGVIDYRDSSWNTNGHSLLLRLDYGRTRILMTGDLNSKSQADLLEYYTGQRQELECDVAKGCHHGSEEVSFKFLATMRAAATIISSGDNEGHAHPRPNLVAASAISGYQQLDEDMLVTPLVYSTELARSTRSGDITKVAAENYHAPEDQLIDVELDERRYPKARVHYKEVRSGDLNPRKGSRRLPGLHVVSGIVYGLVNVRTDGDRILCATMNEKDGTWDVHTFHSRF